MDTEWPKWRAETAVAEERTQKGGSVQVVNPGTDLRKRTNDVFWNELMTASLQHLGHPVELMHKE